MSRKYMNERWCVRCNRTSPCPYLKNNLNKLGIDIDTIIFDQRLVVDIGCGNGRNSKYMKTIGFPNVISLDMAGDFDKKCILGVDRLPIEDGAANIILCNYLVMFLNKKERANLMKEVCRIAANGCCIMVELYPAKDSFATTKEDMSNMLDDIFNHLGKGWGKIRYARAGGKFIAKKEY